MGHNWKNKGDEPVSMETAFMLYNNKSPWRQEITTAKIQISGRSLRDNRDYDRV